jgi:small subunit ribosomal protein S6
VTDYEILLMLDPELPEERQSEIVTRAREAIERDGGKFDAHEPWGRRRLAYEIDKHFEGIYAVVDLHAEPAATKELDRQLNLNESVLRTKVLRIPDKPVARGSAVSGGPAAVAAASAAS